MHDIFAAIGLFAVSFVMFKGLFSFFSAVFFKKNSKDKTNVAPNKPASGREFSDFKGWSWQWLVEKDAHGKKGPADENLTSIILQHIRDQQTEQHVAMSKLLKAQNKELRKLNSYLRQVFGGDAE